MNERREPTIAPLNIDEQSLKPQATRAGTSSPQATNPQARAQAQTARPKANTPPPVSSRKTEASPRSFMAGFAFFIAVLASAGAGFVYFQLLQTQSLLSSVTKQLAQSDTRIIQLEEKLELTGDESVQSTSVLQANIKTNSSEIKKLWAVAYDRNRKAIADNTDSITALEKTYKSSDSKLNKSLADLRADVSVLNELMEAQQGILAKVDGARKEQMSSLTNLSSKIEALDNKLTKKVLSNEEAIKAIDAFRLQVNRDLLRLQGG